MKDFGKLKVWEKAQLPAVRVYRVTSGFPRQEMFGLTSQMRRASAWIPSNLAEGGGRRFDAELAHFAAIAMGSASELEYQILLAKDPGYLADEDSGNVTRDVLEVKRMLSGPIRRVRHGGRPVASSVAS
jgi:four helix bundle protein